MADQWPTGAELIARERERQIAKGYTAEHDDRWTWKQLYDAGNHAQGGPMWDWPWPGHPFKSEGRMRDFARAGALFIAASERVERHGLMYFGEDALARARQECAGGLLIATRELDRLLLEVSEAVGGPVKKPEPSDV